MRKLEQKDICGYLPYSLQFFSKGENDIIKEAQYPILHIGHAIQKREFDKIIPILYPLEALYKPYPYNGKEIIPILECAKIDAPEINNQENYGINFFYDEKKKEFVRAVFGERVSVNQVQLFDFLCELKIDYRNLIDAGLAISVYDLNENPYK